MKIQVQYFGQLRQLADTESEVLDLPEGSDLLAILSRASQSRDVRFSKILFASEDVPSASVMMLVNNELASKNPRTAFRDGDVLTLIPAISGG